ncbi:MAG: hypothetical protein U0457_12530 [Candidatus Sericytochromatia bacterium]
MEKEEDSKIVAYFKLAFWCYLAYFTYIVITKKLETIDAFIHNIDLPIHEFGHVFFNMLFMGNPTMMSMGGNAFQFIFPCVLAGAFYFRKDLFGGGFCTLWAGETLIDASYYISDARTRDLPLITGDPDTHDWFNVLSDLNIIQYDTLLGKIVFFFGAVLMIIGLIIAFYQVNKEGKFIEVKL